MLRGAEREMVHAVDGVSFAMRRGKILGLVGESGSGKTTTAMNILGLVEPSKGEIRFNGQDVQDMVRGRNRLALRRQMQMIFQDPYEALNPRQTIFQIVAEPLEVHGLVRNKAEKLERVETALSDAGLKPPGNFLNRYPEDLSGGQRQRVVIAGALVLQPQLLVADEPVSMLDVSIRAEILNLLRQLRDTHNISILYITHDLATAGFFTDRIAVMYLGRIVEIGPTTDVLKNPKHPYTKALLSVVPVANPRKRRQRVILQGEIPNPIHIPQGCRFHPRCPAVIETCKTIDPMLQPTQEHSAACILVKTQEG
ncbi:MAG: ABC transporter ATP-binding protein [Anaerolineae bacterium]|nr:ABC transporter ATP-binding protein [Anaerolineae bacterium]